MALESPVVTAADLVVTNPIANDPRSEGDDHIRSIKIAVKALYNDGGVRGSIAGLTLSNNATVTKLDVAAGTCRDSTNVTNITLAAAITAGLIQTSGAWAAGNMQNKLDTGARANSTWYHVWAIKKDSDGSGDFLFSLSVSAPTMPVGYTYKRRIGSVRTTSGGDITAFSQNGDEFLWSVVVQDFSVLAGVTTAVLRTLTVPTGVKVLARYRACAIDGGSGAGFAAAFTSPDESDQAAGIATGAILCNVISQNFNSELITRTNTSAQIRTRTEDTTMTVRANTYGWIDTRGRND